MSLYANSKRAATMVKAIKRVRLVDAGASKPGNVMDLTVRGLVAGEVYDVVEVNLDGDAYLLPGFDRFDWINASRFVDADAPPAPEAVPTDWFTLYLAGDKQARKQAPIARGLIQYFPNTCINVAHVSYVANEQHNPGLPMQWAFDKSTDEADCQIRHAIDAAGNPVDDDGLLHLTKKAWRAFAECERYLLEKYPQARAGASVTGRGVK